MEAGRVARRMGIRRVGGELEPVREVLQSPSLPRVDVGEAGLGGLGADGGAAAASAAAARASLVGGGGGVDQGNYTEVPQGRMPRRMPRGSLAASPQCDPRDPHWIRDFSDHLHSHLQRPPYCSSPSHPSRSPSHPAHLHVPLHHRADRNRGDKGDHDDLRGGGGRKSGGGDADIFYLTSGRASSRARTVARKPVPLR